MSEHPNRAEIAKTVEERLLGVGSVTLLTEMDVVADQIASALLAAGLIVPPGMTAETDALVEQMANALSNCSEMLNGLDQMLVMMRGGEAVFNKSPLTYEVDAAMRAWRGWKFDAPLGEG